MRYNQHALGLKSYLELQKRHNPATPPGGLTAPLAIRQA